MRCYGKQVREIGALSGVAAWLGGGSTLNSLFKVPVCRTQTKHAKAERKHDVHRYFARPSGKLVHKDNASTVDKCRVLACGRDNIGSLWRHKCYAPVLSHATSASKLVIRFVYKKVFISYSILFSLWYRNIFNIYTFILSRWMSLHPLHLRQCLCCIVDLWD